MEAAMLICFCLLRLDRWKLLDFALLKCSSMSFNIEKQETAMSKWSRVRTRAAKVRKGLFNDDKAQKLALQHWLKAVGKGLFNDGKAQKLALQHWFEAVSVD
ncbi:hypothetical protein PVAP13_3NG178614 [Panicum virgatum]|uniref:Uncharacterized protein n=1 Tax=Panicum virgatum TaxID=38727 RepID=A0A8T0U8Y7_PANVG|nr:hypothetical protein PVAP13_3NG178614 [Panicum virgatum]